MKCREQRKKLILWYLHGYYPRYKGIYDWDGINHPYNLGSSHRDTIKSIIINTLDHILDGFKNPLCLTCKLVLYVFYIKKSKMLKKITNTYIVGITRTIWVIKRWFIILYELEKISDTFLHNSVKHQFPKDSSVFRREYTDTWTNGSSR